MGICKMEKTLVGGSREEEEGSKGTQESNGGINKRGKTSWKAQRRMVRCSGQGCKEYVEMQELEMFSGG
jgi:hypothetical protein